VRRRARRVPVAWTAGLGLERPGDRDARRGGRVGARRLDQKDAGSGEHGGSGEQRALHAPIVSLHALTGNTAGTSVERAVSLAPHLEGA
jgi:hypothetical protein